MAKSAKKKAARKRRSPARKAAATRKHRGAAKKAAVKGKRRAAPKKAAGSRKRSAAHRPSTTRKARPAVADAAAGDPMAGWTVEEAIVAIPIDADLSEPDEGPDED